MLRSILCPFQLALRKEEKQTNPLISFCPIFRDTGESSVNVRVEYTCLTAHLTWRAQRRQSQSNSPDHTKVLTSIQTIITQSNVNVQSLFHDTVTRSLRRKERLVDNLRQYSLNTVQTNISSLRTANGSPARADLRRHI